VRQSLATPLGRTSYGRFLPCLELPGAWVRCCCWWGWARAFRSGQAKATEESWAGHHVHVSLAVLRRLRGAHNRDAPTILRIRITLPSATRLVPLGRFSPVLNREDIRAVSDYGSTNGQVFLALRPNTNQIRNISSWPWRWFKTIRTNTETRRVAVVGWGAFKKNIFPGRPAVGLADPAEWSALLKLSGCSAKSGRTATTAPMARIFRSN